MNAVHDAINKSRGTPAGPDLTARPIQLSDCAMICMLAAFSSIWLGRWLVGCWPVRGSSGHEDMTLSVDARRRVCIYEQRAAQRTNIQNVQIHPYVVTPFPRGAE